MQQATASLSLSTVSNESSEAPAVEQLSSRADGAAAIERSQLSARMINEQLVQESNAVAKSYKLAMNRFAASSHEHFAATSLGLGPSSSHKTATRPSSSGSSSSGSSSSSLQGAAAAARKGRTSLGMYKRTLTDAELPASVDWRGTGADGGVKDQASCGSCWVSLTPLVLVCLCLGVQ